MAFRAIGSSYLFRQVAGSERIGALSVAIYPRSDSDGQLRIELTDWRTAGPFDYPDEVQRCAEAAADGVRSIAQQLDADLRRFDITLDRFLYHPTSSDPRVYVQAGRSAFRAALEAYQCDDA